MRMLNCFWYIFLVRHYTLYCFFLNCKNASLTVQCQWNVIKLYIYLLLFTLNKLNVASSSLRKYCARVQTVNTSFFVYLIWINEDLGQNITNGGPVCSLCPPNWPFHAEDKAGSLSKSFFPISDLGRVSRGLAAFFQNHGEWPEQQDQARGDGRPEGKHWVHGHWDPGVVQGLPQGLSKWSFDSWGVQENLWEFLSLWWCFKVCWTCIQDIWL